MSNYVTLREWKDTHATADGPDGINLRKQVITEVKQVNKEELTVDFVISTQSRDRDNDTIAVDGWDLSNYLKNPVVLWVHDHHAPPVAQAVSVTITDRALLATAKFTPRDISPFGFMIFQMYAERFLRATSVGFQPLEWKYRDDDGGFGVDFLKHELWEFSCVPVPSNPDALTLAKSSGIDLRPLRDWAENILEDWDTHKSEIAIPRKGVEKLFRVTAGGDDHKKPQAMRVSLAKQLELARLNLEAMANGDDQLVLSVDEGSPELVEGAADDTSMNDAVHSLRGDLIKFADGINVKFEMLGGLIESFGGLVEAAIKAGPENGHYDFVVEAIKSTIDGHSDTVRSLRNDIGLNVEAKLINFETAVGAKVLGYLEGNKSAVIEEVKAQVNKQLESWFDRFVDFYTERQTDSETRADKRSDQVVSRLRDVQSIMLRVTSTIDGAVEGKQTTGQSLQGISAQLDLHSEVLRELVEALTAGPDSDGETTIEMDEADAPVELEVNTDELNSSLKTAVGASIEQSLRDAISRRMDQIRGRLEH